VLEGAQIRKLTHMAEIYPLVLRKEKEALARDHRCGPGERVPEEILFDRAGELSEAEFSFCRKRTLEEVLDTRRRQYRPGGEKLDQWDCDSTRDQSLSSTRDQSLSFSVSISEADPRPPTFQLKFKNWGRETDKVFKTFQSIVDKHCLKVRLAPDRAQSQIAFHCEGSTDEAKIRRLLQERAL
jgi:hypothetical protein